MFDLKKFKPAIVSLAFFMLFPLWMHSEVPAPDFAFPSKTLKIQQSTFADAMQRGDEHDALRAMVNVGLATTALDIDSADAVVKMYEGAYNSFKSNDTRALTAALLYDLFDKIYDSNRYDFDKRDNFDPSFGDAVRLWSGRMFRFRFNSLNDSIVALLPYLEDYKLSDFGSLIKSDKSTAAVFPTLYDFIADKVFKNHSNIVDARVFAGKVATHLSVSSYKSLRYFLWLSRSLEPDKECLTHYKENIEEESAGVLLRRYLENTDQENDKEGKYSLAKSYLSRFPNGAESVFMANYIAGLSRETVNVNSPEFVYPGNPFSVRLDISNANTVKLALYDVTDLVTANIDKSWRQMIVDYSRLTSRTPLDSKVINTDGNVPFSTFKYEQFLINNPGWYVIVCTDNSLKEVEPRRKVQVINCSRVALFENVAKSSVIYTIDPFSGRPLPNVELRYTDSKSVLGRTGSDASYKVTGDINGRIYAKYNNDIFSNRLWVDKLYKPKDEYSIVNILTDRSVYNPGDTLNWCAVAVFADGNTQTVLQNREVITVLSDANHQPVDTVFSVTDGFGRCNGIFVIPKNGLTGVFSIRTESKDKSGIAGTQWITVSDYKMPSFNVVINGAGLISEADDSVRISGTVMSYAGVPVSGASVKVAIQRVELFYRNGYNVTAISKETEADSEGVFNILVSKSDLTGSDGGNYAYRAIVDATSMNGESQSASQLFFLSDPIFIRVGNLPYNILLDGKNIKIPAKIEDASSGEVDSLLLDCRLLTTDSVEVWNQKIDNNTTEVDWNAVPSGSYILKMAVYGNEKVMPVCRNVVLYRADDKQSPSKELLWTPGRELEVENGAATVLLGTTAPLSYILLSITTDDGYVSRQWFTLESGMHTVDVRIPDDAKGGQLLISVIYKMQQKELSVRFSNASAKNSLRIEKECFRENLNPGSKEHWRFRVIPSGAVIDSAAVIVDVYNKKLDQLKPHSFGFKLPYIYRWGQWNHISGLNNELNEYYSGKIKTKALPPVKYPQWELYGQALYPFFRGRYFMEMKSAAGVNMVMKSEDCFDEDCVAEGVSTVTCDMDAGAPGYEDAGIENLRGKPVAVAGFYPEMSVDSTGVLNVDVDIPNENSTWVVKVLAYTKGLVRGEQSLEFTASKPIMIETNYPRFLRVGDKVRFTASVVNNSDLSKTCKSRIELFNPENGSAISRDCVVSYILPGQSEIIGVTAQIPDIPLLGVRSVASDGDFSDGEAVYIPILPATADVIESEQFYLNADSDSVNLKIPRIPDNADVALYGCYNPIWYAVTSLKGISPIDPQTAADAIDMLYSAAVAYGIINGYPEVEQALRYWGESNKNDSTLCSLLERNEPLKQMLLSDTPWISDANSQTQRMERLSMLLDSRNIERCLKTAIRRLGELQAPDGGLKWIGSSNCSSDWCTTRLLETVASLVDMDWLPRDKGLKAIVKAAVGRFDSTLVKDYRRFPKENYLYQSYIRTRLKEYPASLSLSECINNTVERCKSDWKKYSLTDKAMAAILLENKGYRRSAANIVASINDFSKQSDKQGTFWPTLANGYNDVNGTLLMLYANEAVNTSGAFKDGIVHWLLLQNEVRSISIDNSSDAVSAAIVRSCPKWLGGNENVRIYVNDKPLNDADAGQFTGSAYYDISSLNPSESVVSVCKSGSTPVWGAVTWRFSNSIDSIAAQSCDDISIEKNLYRRVVKNGTVVWEATDTFKVGDVIRSEFVVQSSRSLDYITMIDNRAACFEPTEQLPETVYDDGVVYYRENREVKTQIFAESMPKGYYRFSYDSYASQSGEFFSGTANVQSQYAPHIAAHSSGRKIVVLPK